jgi:hypothetical protein
MVITAALISLVVVAAPAEPQPPPDQPPAYTLSGVRRAAAGAGPQADEATPAAVPSKPLARSAAGQQLAVGTRVPKPAVTQGADDRFVTTSLAPMGSGWHQEFLDMTAPPYGSSPYDAMSNVQRVQGVASSMAFALAIDGIVRLVDHLRTSYHDRKVTKVRREIDAETAEVERIYKARQAGRAQDSTAPNVK